MIYDYVFIFRNAHTEVRHGRDVLEAFLDLKVEFDKIIGAIKIIPEGGIVTCDLKMLQHRLLKHEVDILRATITQLKGQLNDAIKTINPEDS